MANNYLQFSCVLDGLDYTQCEWLKEYLGNWKRDDDADDNGPYFQYQITLDEGSVWFYAEEGGEPADVAKAVQDLFKHFKMPDIWMFSWASTCSRMRVDEFSGGACVVSAKKLYFVEASDWAWKKKRELSRRQTRAMKAKTKSKPKRKAA